MVFILNYGVDGGELLYWRAMRLAKRLPSRLAVLTRALSLKHGPLGMRGYEDHACKLEIV